MLESKALEPDGKRNGTGMNRNCWRPISLDVEPMRRNSDTKNSVKYVNGWRMTRLVFALRQQVLAAAVLVCLLFLSSAVHSETEPDRGERVVLELSALSKHGDGITRARDQVLEILQKGNACTAWFQESDPDPAEVFRSLHFEIEEHGPSRSYGIRNSDGEHLFKHPWGAKSFENAGRNSTILLNANGPFFRRTSTLMQLAPGGMARPSGNLMLVVSDYSGNTPEAQIVILLHELGHIIGRLPEDNDSWDGRSGRNTSEVLRHCKAETRAAAHNSLKSDN